MAQKVAFLYRRWYEFVFFATRALIIGSSILFKTALRKATMICLILCWAIYMHVRYVPFYSHGHRHIATNDRELSIRARWKLQATHGDQLQLLCLVCELVAGLLGIACIFLRETWHTLPDDQRTDTMYLVDGVITFVSICCAFGPPLSTFVMQKKYQEEHNAAMEVMDQKLEQLSSLPTYASPTAREQAYHADGDVTRYRVVHHEGVTVVPKFNEHSKKNHQKAVAHKGEVIRLAFGSVIEALDVKYDDMGVPWVCIERISFASGGDEAKGGQDQQVGVETHSKAAGIINFLEVGTGLDLDHDGDIGRAGGTITIDYEETYCACGDAKDPDAVFLEEIDETDPMHPHLWKVAADCPDGESSPRH
eukprot:COSAG06_NODE_5122_length_3704_cov_6.355895_3_plen_364_part_00